MRINFMVALAALIVSPIVNAEIILGKTSVSAAVTKPGDTLTVTTQVTSTVNMGKLQVGIHIYDKSGRGISKNYTAHTFDSQRLVTKTYNFILPANLGAGQYRVATSVYLGSPWTYVGGNPNAATFEVTSAIATPPQARLLWSDEFDTLNLMSATNPKGTWRPNSRWQNPSSGGFKDFAGTNWNINPNHPDFAAYTPFSTAGGILTIKSIRTPQSLTGPIKEQMAQQGIGGAVPEWSGGYLVQNPLVQKHKYGYFEFRARWPNSGKGMFPALWMLGSEGNLDQQNKGAAEIDILEMFGKPNLVKTTLHMYDNNRVGTSQSVGKVQIDTSVWHSYAVDWQPAYLRFYFDGVLVHEITGASATWYSSTMNLRLNYAMDARWFAADSVSDFSTPEELIMNVDYVRVYDRKP